MTVTVLFAEAPCASAIVLERATSRAGRAAAATYAGGVAALFEHAAGPRRPQKAIAQLARARRGAPAEVEA